MQNNNEKYPICFLDLDDVIVLSSNRKDFHQTPVNNLKYIIKETKCKIVVHSTWRNFPENRKLFFYLWGKWGFDLNDFLDFAPTGLKIVKDNISGDNDIEYYITKKQVIDIWLEDNKNRVENYVILDDEDYNFPPDKHVQPQYVGLSFEEAKRAIEILNR